MHFLPFHLHAFEIALVFLVGLVHHRSVTGPAERRRMTGALALVVLCVAWPLGDLAAEVSLTAAAVQRLILVLAVGPLLWRSLPLPTVVRLTEPRFVDALTTKLAQPGVAMVVTTVLGTVTLSPGFVAWGARGVVGRVVLVALTVVAGVVLWLPVLGRIPGARHLSSAGAGAYLFASALVVTAMGFVWLFARHPLYPSLHHTQAVVHLSPLADQQLAGVVAKVGAFLVLWIVAVRIFFQDVDTEREGDRPLYVADVERWAQRAARKARRRQG